MNKNIFAIATATIIFGLSGFYGGIYYQKHKTPNFERGQFQNGINRPTGFSTRNGAQIGRSVSGEITNIEDNTITVKAQDGSSKIVVLSDTTKFNNTLEGSRDDLKSGEQVMVIGTEGSDGTVTAQTISIGVATPFGMPSGQPSGENQ